MNYEEMWHALKVWCIKKFNAGEKFKRVERAPVKMGDILQVPMANVLNTMKEIEEINGVVDDNEEVGKILEWLKEI